MLTVCTLEFQIHHTCRSLGQRTMPLEAFCWPELSWKDQNDSHHMVLWHVCDYNMCYCGGWAVEQLRSYPTHKLVFCPMLCCVSADTQRHISDHLWQTSTAWKVEHWCGWTTKIWCDYKAKLSCLLTILVLSLFNKVYVTIITFHHRVRQFHYFNNFRNIHCFTHRIAMLSCRLFNTCATQINLVTH